MRCHRKHTYSSLRLLVSAQQMPAVVIVTVDLCVSSLRTRDGTIHLFVFQCVKCSASHIARGQLNVKSPNHYAARGPAPSDQSGTGLGTRSGPWRPSAAPFISLWFAGSRRDLEVSGRGSRAPRAWQVGCGSFQCYFPTSAEIFQCFNHGYICSAVYQVTTPHRADTLILIIQTKNKCVS